MKRCSHAIVGLFSLVTACDSGVPRATIERIVARDAVFFESGSPDAALTENLAAARVVLLGETHYVQQHQEFLVLLLQRLHAAGFRFILQEDLSATAWAGEEYVALRSDELPREVAAFERTLLEGIRSFNAGLPESQRIHFAGIDINHWRGIFPPYMRLFQQRFGRVSQLDELLAAAPESLQYVDALNALPARLAADQERIEASIGADRYRLLVDLVEVEIKSFPLRLSTGTASWNDARELIMRDGILKVLSVAGDAGVAINCGMYHAQKTKYMGPTTEFLGTWLANNPQAYGGDASKLRSIAFVGAKGERKSNFNDPATWTFDITQEGSENDLTRILANQSNGRYAWLPLTDPLFTTQFFEVDYGRDIRTTRPGRQFDSIFLYPTVTVLSSLSLFQ